MAGSSVSNEELRSFHEIDRELYKRLVINLGLDIFQCIQMIFFWLWLEEMGYPNIIMKMLALPDRVLRTIVEETARCLECLFSENPPPSLINSITEIPLTQELMDGLPISLSILFENRLGALSRITRTVADMGLRVFDDIAQEALLLAGATNHNSNPVHQQEVVNQGMGTQPDNRSMGIQPAATIQDIASTNTSSNEWRAQQPFTGPSAPVILRPNIVHQEFVGPSSAQGWIRPPIYHVHHPLVYGSGFGFPPPPPPAVMNGAARNMLPQIIGHMGQPLGVPGGVVLLQHPMLNPGLPSITEVGEPSSQQSFFNPPVADPWRPSNNNEEVPPGERTMFITFSRGYPITERELRNFLVSSYGSDCIEDLYMQDVPPNKQSLFARVVFRSITTVAMILDGKEKAKFAINGKHVWARPFVDKHNNSGEPPAPSAS